MSLGARLIGLEGVHLGRRLGVIAAGLAMALLLAGTALAFVAIALHAALLERFSPIEAALLVAAVAILLLAIVAGLTSAAIRRARRRARAAVGASLMAAAAPPLVSLSLRHAGTTALALIVLAAVLRAKRR